MKKVLFAIQFLAIILNISPSIAHDKMMESMPEFLKEVKNKSYIQSASSAKDWNKYHIDEANLVIKELQKLKAQVPAKDQDKYTAVIDTLGQLRTQLKDLPIPSKGFKKTFDLVPEWMKLKKEMFKLKGKELQEIAKQTGSPVARKLARFHTRAKSRIRQGMSNLRSRMMQQQPRERMMTADEIDLKR